MRTKLPNITDGVPLSRFANEEIQSVQPPRFCSPRIFKFTKKYELVVSSVRFFWSSGTMVVIHSVSPVRVGTEVGATVGFEVGIDDGADVGFDVLRTPRGRGEAVGTALGRKVGWPVGC